MGKLALALALLPLPAFADPGGRPAALGGAYSALADDAYAPVHNPAGLGQLRGAEASVQFLERRQATVALPLMKTQGLGASLETGGGGEGAYTLGYGAKAAAGFSVGAGLRLTERGDERRGSADVGGLYRLQQDLSLGLAVQGVGDSISPRLGVGWGPVNNALFALEWLLKDKEGGLRAGLEWRAYGPLLLRAGLDTFQNRAASNELGLTAGLGYDLGFSELSYAYSRDRQALSAVVRFGARGEVTSGRSSERSPTEWAEPAQPAPVRANDEAPPTLYQAVPAN